MDPHNLQKASEYINNLLLSRGLLRNGKPIEFVVPSPTSGEGESDAVSAKIINLVHDLILRRDRESEQREHLAITIQNLRSTEAKSNAEIGRLQLQNAELERQLSLAQGQEHTLKANVRRAEDAAKAVREEMQRLKITIKNVRAQCANDLRQQDQEIRRLKTHLEAKQRGSRAPPTATTTSVSAESSQRKDTAVPLTSPEYSLSQESSEFLAQLCQNLSDENDSLIALIQSSLARLRSIQGLQNARVVADEGDHQPRHHHHHQQSQVRIRTTLARALPTPCETLAAEMQKELDQLQNILTNPSFVPIEEVEVREEEIIRLRQGWEKMEIRWREAVAMMDGWRRRIADDGTLVNMDEAGRSPVKAREGRNVIEDDEMAMSESTGSNEMRIHGSGEEEEAGARIASISEISHPSYNPVNLNTPQNPGIPEEPEKRMLDTDQRRILKEIQPNNIEESSVGGQIHDIDTVTEKNVHQEDLPQKNTPAEIHLAPEPASTTASEPSSKKNQSKISNLPRQTNTRKRQASTEIPGGQQQQQQAPRSSKLARISTPTIEQKLKEAKNEADEATTTTTTKGDRCESVSQTRRNQIMTRKKNGAATTTTTTTRPRKKRNTLSPEELEYLLGVTSQ